MSAYSLCRQQARHRGACRLRYCKSVQPAPVTGRPPPGRPTPACQSISYLDTAKQHGSVKASRPSQPLLLQCPVLHCARAPSQSGHMRPGRHLLTMSSRPPACRQSQRWPPLSAGSMPAAEPEQASETEHKQAQCTLEGSCLLPGSPVQARCLILEFRTPAAHGSNRPTQSTSRRTARCRAAACSREDQSRRAALSSAALSRACAHERQRQLVNPPHAQAGLTPA